MNERVWIRGANGHDDDGYLMSAQWSLVRTSPVPGPQKFGACEGRAGASVDSGPSEGRQWGASRGSPKRAEDMATWQMRRATQMPYPLLEG